MADPPPPRPELSEMNDMGALMKRWEEEHNPGGQFDPTPIITRMAEVVEAELDTFNKMDPDPFDERHPSRADPSCMLGQVLKVIFKKDTFMDKLVNEYLRDNYWHRVGAGDRDSTELNIAACRLVLDVLPGLEASAVFHPPEADPLILRLFSWAEKAADPLRSYAVGLLAAAMEIQETAAVFREQNTRFVPLMLTRLKALQEEMVRHQKLHPPRPFAHLNHDATPTKKKMLRRSSGSCNSSPRRRLHSPPPPLATPLMSPPTLDGADPHDKRTNGIAHHRNHMEVDPSEQTLNVSDCSNSSWAEMESYVIASASIYPLTLPAKQMLILRYLTPMGEYQEFLSYIIEHNALSLILNYTNIRETRETRLGFEALKYLAALLCHKKTSLEFIAMGGVQRLLEVPRPSVAATGVSICFYYLAYCEDAMEKICSSPKYIVTELISYAQWLLECSHNSGRCHATMFFGLSFQFRTILDEFDAQDGLRKMFNVMNTLPIVNIDDESPVLNEDEECSYRQIVRHVTVALKRYYEAHLAIKVPFYLRLHDRSVPPQLPPYKGQRSTPEEVHEQIETLLELMPLSAPWPCVDHFHNFGGISLLLRIVALAYEWNFSGRVETVQSALAILSVCCIRPAVQMTFCERINLPDHTMSVGMNIILGSCEGEVVPDPEVQKTALHLIINCVCAPINRPGSHSVVVKSTDSSASKRRMRSSEELIQKIWASVRENNGIIVLLMLMMVKTPITDADALRALACRALAGLARCDKVRQIVSKLPVLTNGSMQVALKDPILHEKRAEHVQFQKHYLTLIEHIMGDQRSQPTNNTQDLSLTNIHRANVVAQTRITYNKTQLYQLIHQQLLNDGLIDAAASLLKEANLSLPKPPTPAAFPSNRLSLMGRKSVRESPRPSTIHPPSTPNSQPNTPTSPIKLSLNRRERGTPVSCGTPNRSLQKQTSYDSSGVVLVKPPQPPLTFPDQYRVSLHSIVTEYLTNQHALCKNPMVTCPQFNLFVPHKCPDPKSRVEAPNNFTMRFLKRQSGFRVSNSMDIRLSHSRFCPETTIRMNPDDGIFTCCEFMPNSPYLALGTYHGELRLYNANTGAEEAVYHCHESFLSNIESNRAGNLVLTSSTWRRPLSALWTMDTLFDMKLNFDEEEFAEFSKTVQDKIVGTKGTNATIYDIETGVATVKLAPVLSNTYSKNRATFNPTDELILTDGVLFDVRSAQEIHKFDKLNSVLSGVFHPNGLEVLSNTEIWDLRTFHLLRTVPTLDHQQIKFNPAGSVIYTYSFEHENSDDDLTYESSFKTLDSRNYTSIATIDTKKEIYQLTCNAHDTQIAVVENQGENRDVQETTVRLYNVGRRRDKEDEVQEEDEEDLSADDGSGSGSDDNNRDTNEIAEFLVDAFRARVADGAADAPGEFPENDDDDPEFLAVNSDDDDDDDDDDGLDDGSSSSNSSHGGFSDDEFFDA